MQVEIFGMMKTLHGGKSAFRWWRAVEGRWFELSSGRLVVTLIGNGKVTRAVVTFIDVSARI